MYKVLVCLKSVLEETRNTEGVKDLLDRALNLCLEASAIVADVVNSDSPEGHLPDAPLPEEEDGGRTAQLLLLCAWRTVKDASLLIGEICSRCPWLSEHTVANLAEHFVQQLSNITHRGAFEQAYVGFCQVNKKSKQAGCKQKVTQLHYNF